MTSEARISSRPSRNLSYNGVASLIRRRREGFADLLRELEAAGRAALLEEKEGALEGAGRAALLEERRRTFLGGSAGGSAGGAALLGIC